ncbi:MAG: response regulator [Candidatus Synoicihabitans palmerolidicus]|nr:response regulator [Candidatus Synoicihabitans palmerolidicus]
MMLWSCVASFAKRPNGNPTLRSSAPRPMARIALQKLTQVNPDVVTLDIEMPEINSLETLRMLRKHNPRLPVIMFSATTRQGAVATLDALAAGANDYVTKPTDVRDLNACLQRLQSDLAPRVRQLFEAIHAPRTAPAPQSTPTNRATIPPPAVPRFSSTFRATPDLVCISTSTGGPNALADLFARFTVPIPVPVAIVQHMPPMFTSLLAELIDRGPGAMHCVEATDGMRLTPGTAVLAPGGRHLAITRSSHGDYIARINDAPPENSCRTAAQSGARVLSVVMTGMGSDGVHGCEFVHQAGGSIIIQDQASSVIWGMPGAVAATNLPHTAHSLLDLAPPNHALPVRSLIARRMSSLTAHLHPLSRDPGTSASMSIYGRRFTANLPSCWPMGRNTWWKLDSRPSPPATNSAASTSWSLPFGRTRPLYPAFL